jgi:hypothetical protein
MWNENIIPNYLNNEILNEMDPKMKAIDEIRWDFTLSFATQLEQHCLDENTVAQVLSIVRILPHSLYELFPAT